MWRQAAPRWECLPGRRDRGVDVLGAPLRDPGQSLSAGWVDDVECLPWPGPGATDEMPERRVMRRQPGARRTVTFRRRTILHGLEDFGDCGHWRLRASGDGAPMHNDR